MEDTLKPIVVRIVIGTVFGSTLVSLFFAIWSLVVHVGGPSIGTLIFVVISLAGVVYLMYEMVYKPLKPTDDAILL